jgi:2-haloacid dehalogenase
MLEKFGIDGLDATGIDDFNRAWHRLDPWPDSPPGLQRLKSKFILATMSNGNIALMVDMAKYAGLPWDTILGAELAHAYKPDAKTYLTGVELLHLKPEQVMMVAAHQGDLLAAAKQGLRTAFVKRPLERGVNGKVDTTPDPSFDYVCDDFRDLATQLGV